MSLFKQLCKNTKNAQKAYLIWTKTFTYFHAFVYMMDNMDIKWIMILAPHVRTRGYFILFALIYGYRVVHSESATLHINASLWQ